MLQTLNIRKRCIIFGSSAVNALMMMTHAIILLWKNLGIKPIFVLLMYITFGFCAIGIIQILYANVHILHVNYGNGILQED